MATMELITGNNENGFLVRFAYRRDPTLHNTDFIVGSIPRVVFDLINGAELDELIEVSFIFSVWVGSGLNLAIRSLT